MSNSRESHNRNGRLPYGIMLVMVALAVGFAVANTSASSVAQPAIAQAFDAKTALVGWVVFGYTITFAVSTAIYGRVAERFGKGRTLAFGILLLSLGSMLAAASPSLNVVIAARLIQGAGAGAIPTMSFAIVADRSTLTQRALGFGVITGAVGIAQALGPIMGGLLVDLVSWRAAVAIGVLTAPVALVVLYDQPELGNNERKSDLKGAIAVSLLVGSFVFAVNRFPVDGATIATVLALLVAAGSGYAVRYRSRRHPDPFVPQQLLADSVFVAVALVGALGSATYLGTLVGLPPGLGQTREIDAVGIGLVLAPMAASVAVAASLNGILQRWMPRGGTTLASSALLIGGVATQAVLGVHQSLLAIALAGIPLGLGFGLLGPPLLGEIAARFKGRDQPSAIGIYYLCFFLGGAVGGAISTGFIQRGFKLPGFEPGLPTSQAVLAILGIAGLVLGWHSLFERNQT